MRAEAFDCVLPKRRRDPQRVERWVNAEVNLTVPLGVPVEADPADKQDAVADVMDQVARALGAPLSEHVTSGRWVDMPQPSPVTAPPSLTAAERYALEAMPIPFGDDLMVPVEHRALGSLVEQLRLRGLCTVTHAGWDLTTAGRIVLSDLRRDRAALERQVIGALRSCIDVHGPITPNELGSAARRVVGQLGAYLAGSEHASASLSAARGGPPAVT